MNRLASLPLALALAHGILSTALWAGCGSSPARQEQQKGLYPAIAPPVEQATPAALKNSAQTALPQGQHALHAKMANVADANVTASLDAADFSQRFFQAGPTNIFNILRSVDDLIEDISRQASAGAQPCMSQEPVGYDLAVPGEAVTMYAQCFEQQPAAFAGDPHLLQWAKVAGSFHVYSASGVGWIAAIATPLARTATDETPTAASDYSVRAWFSVGFTNSQLPAGALGTGWFNGSYGLVALTANPKEGSFELTAAGVGMGYCGAHFVSDGTSVFGIGSIDMAASCLPPGEICLDASSGSKRESCTVSAENFVLTPLGRDSVSVTAATTWAASGYPGSKGNLVRLDGTATDSAHFGPSVPPSGVGVFALSDAKP